LGGRIKWPETLPGIDEYCANLEELANNPNANRRRVNMKDTMEFKAEKWKDARTMARECPSISDDTLRFLEEIDEKQTDLDRLGKRKRKKKKRKRKKRKSNQRVEEEENALAGEDEMGGGMEEEEEEEEGESGEEDDYSWDGEE